MTLTFADAASFLSLKAHRDKCSPSLKESSVKTHRLAVALELKYHR